MSKEAKGAIRKIQKKMRSREGHPNRCLFCSRMRKQGDRKSWCERTTSRALAALAENVGYRKGKESSISHSSIDRLNLDVWIPN
jgi:hypothetical protein